MKKEVESPFNWKYALGMTKGRTRHTVYKDWDKKVQKEVHGNDVSFWADGVKEPFATEQNLINWYNMQLTDRMHHINIIRESDGLPIFKTLEEYLTWSNSDIEYDN